MNITKKQLAELIREEVAKLTEATETTPPPAEEESPGLRRPLTVRKSLDREAIIERVLNRIVS